MSEIETVPEKPSAVDHHEPESNYSNNEKASSFHEDIDNNPAPETEESSEVYDPNVYAGVSRPDPTLH
jgi:hypothetical protein